MTDAEFVCDECDPPREFKTAPALAAHRTRTHKEPDAVTDEGQSQLFTEGKPEVSPGFLAKLHWRRPKEAAAAPPPTRESKPRRATPRTSAVHFFTALSSWVGGWVAGRDLGVGRCMVLQAPASGVLIDRAIKGTFVDKLVQPIVRMEEDALPVALLVAGPMTVGMVERGVISREMGAQMLREYLVRLGPAMVEAFKQARKEEQAMAAALSELAPVLGLPEGTPVDPDVILAWMLEAAGAYYEPEATTPEAPAPAA